MKRVWSCLVQLVVLTFLVACSSTTIPNTEATVVATPSAVALVIEEPTAGKATIAGRLLSSQTKTPLAQMPVYLAEVYRQGEEGAYVLDGASSPGAVSNDQGEFVIPNVDPKEYVIIAGDPYASNDVVKEISGKPKPWTLVGDQIINTGDIEVNLQP